MSNCNRKCLLSVYMSFLVMVFLCSVSPALLSFCRPSVPQTSGLPLRIDHCLLYQHLKCEITNIHIQLQKHLNDKWSVFLKLLSVCIYLNYVKLEGVTSLSPWSIYSSHWWTDHDGSSHLFTQEHVKSPNFSFFTFLHV